MVLPSGEIAGEISLYSVLTVFPRLSSCAWLFVKTKVDITRSDNIRIILVEDIVVVQHSVFTRIMF